MLPSLNGEVLGHGLGLMIPKGSSNPVHPGILGFHGFEFLGLIPWFWDPGTLWFGGSGIDSVFDFVIDPGILRSGHSVVLGFCD